MAQAGPRQVFPANIVRISFPTAGAGLLFIRIGQRSDGSGTIAAPKALVKDLPWPDFDAFELNEGAVDPDGTPKNTLVAIVNPVSENMLSKYLYWPQYKHVQAQVRTPNEPIQTLTVDLASWTIVYGGVIGGRLSQIMTREQALLHFQQTSDDPSKVGVILTNNGTPFNSDAELIAYANAAGWTYHFDTTAVPDNVKQDDAVVLMINLVKLLRDIPNGANGKKPAQYTFNIDLPNRPPTANNHGTRLDWFIWAAAFKSKLSDPPKDDERLDYPVIDKKVPISGISGQFDTDYLWPNFDISEDANLAQLKVEFIGTNENLTVSVRVTFGVGSVAPIVEVFYADTGSEVEG